MSKDIEAGRAHVTTYVKNNLFLRGMKDMQSQLHSLSAHATKIGGTMLRAGTMGVAAFGGIAAALLAPLKAAGDLMETTSKFGSVFGQQTAAVKAWGDAYADAVGRSKSETMAGLATFQSFFQGLSIGGEQAAGFSKEMQGLAVDFASFHNLADSEAMQRFISALSGSGEVLSMFGVNIMQAALDQKLLQMGFKKSTAGATEMQKVLARMEIIKETMGRQGAVGDAIKTAGSFSNQLKALQGSIKNTAESFGNDLLPVVTPMLTKARELVEISGRWIRENSGLAVSIGQVAVAGAAVSAAVAAGGVAFLGIGAALNGAAMGFGALRIAMLPGAYALGGIRATLTRLTQVTTHFVGGALRTLTTSIGSGLSTAASIGASGLSMIGRAAMSMGSVVMSAGSMAFNSLVSIASATYPIIVSATKKLGGEMQYWLGRPWQYLKASFPILLGDLTAGTSSAMSRIRTMAGTAADGMRAAWQSASSRVSGTLSTLAGAITSRLSSVTGPIGERISAVWASVTTRASAAWNKITGTANGMLARLQNRFKSVMPLIGQDFARLSGYAARASAGIVSAFRMAGPAIARGLTTAVQAALTRIRLMGATTARMMGRGVSGIGGALSGMAGLLSMAGAGAGGMLGQLAGVVPMLLMVGTSLAAAINPATLLIAAIAGGVYIWTQYSDSGKAALNTLSQAFAPLAETARRTFDGVANAIQAGNLALAGKVAMAGLKLAFIDGMIGLGQVLIGQWSEVSSEVGENMNGEGMLTPWENTLGTMAAVWDQWAVGVVKTFTDAMRQVTDKWQGTVEGIANYMLSKSAEGGIWGQMMSGILGVDMSQEQARAELDKQGKIQSAQKRVTQFSANVEEAKQTGGLVQGSNQAAWEKALADAQADLAKWTNTTIDMVGESQRDVAANVTKSAEEFRKYLDDIDRDAQAKADGSAPQLPDWNGMRDRASTEFEAVKAQAAKELADAKAKADAKKDKVFDGMEPPPPPGAKDLPSQKDIRENFGTFSGAALAMAGNDGGATARIAKAAEEQKTLLDKQLKEFQDAGKGIWQLVQKFGMV